MTKLIEFLKADVRNIVRDEVLLYIPLAPIVVGLVLRFGLPALGNSLPQLDSADHYTFLLGLFLLMSPIMVGWVFGFIFLDEKDLQVMPVIRTSSLGLKRFLLFRMSLCFCSSCLLALLSLTVAGLVPLDIGRIWPVILLAGMEGPLLALFLAVFARDKIQGLALGKVYGMLALLGPVAGYLISSKWHFAGGLSPAYWVSQSFILAHTQPAAYPLYLLVGMLLHLGLAGCLAGVFLRRGTC